MTATTMTAVPRFTCPSWCRTARASAVALAHAPSITISTDAGSRRNGGTWIAANTSIAVPTMTSTARARTRVPSGLCSRPTLSVGSTFLLLSPMSYSCGTTSPIG